MFIHLFDNIYYINRKTLSLMTLLMIMLFFEIRKYRKKKLRQSQCIYLTVKGKVIERKFVTRPYYHHIFSGGLQYSARYSYRNILITTVKDTFGKTYDVNVAKDTFYKNVDLSDHPDIGNEVVWNIKKYTDEEFYVLVELVASEGG